MIVSELAAKRRIIKRIAISIVMIACVMLVAVHAWTSWEARRQQLSNAGAASANTARVLADQASSAFKMVDTVLVSMVDRVEVDGLSEPRRDILRVQMAKHLAELPALQGVFIYDREATWIVNSAGRHYEGRRNEDRAFFQYHRDHPGRGVHVGAPIIGRTSGVWVIPVSRRVEDTDGNFNGVVLATIKVDFFRDIYEGIDLPPDGEIVLALDDGTRLLGIPYLSGEVGTSIADAPVFRTLAARDSHEGMFEAVEDGVTRIHSFCQVGDYPVLVAYARSRDDVLRNWRHNTAFVSAALALLIGGLGMLGMYLGRQIRQRDRLEHELLGTQHALEASNAVLESQAHTDALSGLYNRRYVEAALERELAAARRDGTPLAVLMLDVDYFKKYNDRYGHLEGDVCLAQVARVIEGRTMRPRDVAARFGGEEFVVLLPDTGRDRALAVAEGIRADLERRALKHEDAPQGSVSMSIGVSGSARLGRDQTALGLLEQADAALYRAKAAGRNRVMAAGEAPPSFPATGPGPNSPHAPPRTPPPARDSTDPAS